MINQVADEIAEIQKQLVKQVHKIDIQSMTHEDLKKLNTVEDFNEWGSLDIGFFENFLIAIIKLTNLEITAHIYFGNLPRN